MQQSSSVLPARSMPAPSQGKGSSSLLGMIDGSLNIGNSSRGNVPTQSMSGDAKPFVEQENIAPLKRSLPDSMHLQHEDYKRFKAEVRAPTMRRGLSDASNRLMSSHSAPHASTAPYAQVQHSDLSADRPPGLYADRKSSPDAIMRNLSLTGSLQSASQPVHASTSGSRGRSAVGYIAPFNRPEPSDDDNSDAEDVEMANVEMPVYMRATHGLVAGGRAGYVLLFS